jgi:adenosylmethionine-8-amino-7-oxononanoate aminotransferase
LTAFELVSDRASMEPLPAQLNAYDVLVNLAYERGLIIYSRRSRDGVEGDHFMVCPPLIVNTDQITEIIEKLAASLDDLAAKLGLPTD